MNYQQLAAPTLDAIALFHMSVGDGLWMGGSRRALVSTSRVGAASC